LTSIPAVRRFRPAPRWFSERNMPVFLSLHVLIAVVFAIHVVRTGQQLFWLIILFSFPLLGSAVYFFAIYLPQTRLPHATRKLAAAASRALDPGRELREATAAYEFTATAQNRMRLAAALLEAGEPKQAAAHYEACMTGPFADDPELRFGAARAFVAAGQPALALPTLRTLRQELPDFRSEQLALLLAEALAADGQPDEAHKAYAAAIARHGTFEARASYLAWMLETGERGPQVGEQRDAIEELMKRWSPATRELNRPLLRRLDAARRGAGR
jgi:hypothetical protein